MRHIIFLNEERPFFDSEHYQDLTPIIREKIRTGGWSVVNAPRPINGEMTWVGPLFRHGIFYAAGSPTC